MNDKGEQHDPALKSPAPLLVKTSFAVGEACPRACNGASELPGAGRDQTPCSHSKAHLQVCGHQSLYGWWYLLLCPLPQHSAQTVSARSLFNGSQDLKEP